MVTLTNMKLIEAPDYKGVSMPTLSDNELLNRAFNSAVASGKSEIVTVSTSVVTLTSANYGAATSATIQVQDDIIRFWVDGTAPTSTSGFLASVGDAIELNSASEIANFKAIRSSTSTTSAHLVCSYFG